MSPPKKHLCPICRRLQPLTHFACHVQSMGGKAMSDAKIEANRQRALARWKKYREEKGKQ